MRQHRQNIHLVRRWSFRYTFTMSRRLRLRTRRAEMGWMTAVIPANHIYYIYPMANVDSKNSSNYDYDNIKTRSTEMGDLL